MAGAVFDPADCGCAADLGVTAKDPMSAMPGMHHAMMMADMPHEQAMSHPAVSPAPQSTHTMPLDHAEAPATACCWLTYRLLFALALLISVILRRVRVFLPVWCSSAGISSPAVPETARRRVGLLFCFLK